MVPSEFYDASVETCVAPDEKLALLSLRRNALKAALAHPIQFRETFITKSWTEQEITRAGMFRRSLLWWDNIRRTCLDALATFSPVCLVDAACIQPLVEAAFKRGRPQTRRLSPPVWARAARPPAPPARVPPILAADSQSVKLEVTTGGARLMFPNGVTMSCVDPSFRAPVSFGICAVCKSFMEVSVFQRAHRRRRLTARAPSQVNQYAKQVTEGIVHCKTCTPTHEQLGRTKELVSQLANLGSFPLVRAIFRSETPDQATA